MFTDLYQFDEETRIRAQSLALIHDLGEALIGDITPFDGISPDEKHLREEMAMKFLACTIRPSNSRFADLIFELWSEYEKGETRASRLVRQLDKLESIDQAIIYEERHGLDLSEFIVQVYIALKEQVILPELQPCFETRLQDHKDLMLRKGMDIVVVFVSGGPGVGKGTQCAQAAREFDFCHISVGDMLREEAKSPTSPYRDFIPESIAKSVLLPAQLTTLLLKQVIGRAQSEGVRKFLLDGFPRSVVQATDFEMKICNRNSTISLDCSEDEMRGRLNQRSGSSNRVDDNPDTVMRRLQTFRENNGPVIAHLQDRGPVYRIDGNRPIDAVYSSIRRSIQEILQKR